MLINLIIPVLLIRYVCGQVNENQIKEAAKLRAELTEKLSPVVKVTPAKQAEIDAIRNEILNAVSTHKYKSGEPAGGAPPVGGRAADPDAKDPVVGSPLWNRIHHSRKVINELVAPHPAPELEIPKNMKFLGRFNLNSNSYRDVIDLVEVQENLNFEYGELVIVWRTIPNSLSGNKHLLIGLTNDSVVLAKLVDGLFQFVDELPIGDNGLNYNGFEAFLHWNNKEGQSEGYAVIASNVELIWVRVGTGGEYNKLEITWRWPIHNVISKFKYFKHNNQSLIFLSVLDSPSLDIYQFNLDNKEFSQIQIIRLSVPSKNIALVEWKKQLLLALPLNNTTQIYKYTDKFNIIKTVPSKNVTSVSGFQAGGLCFFAIGGQEPQIFRYRNNGLDKVDVISKTYQFVRYWMPIAIHTFRDDVLLLVQFEVKFDTHTLSRISTLRWNGEAFETFFNVPCYMEEVLHYNGVNCLIDADNNLGLSGSVILTKSNNVSILVPRSKAKSGLFDLKIEIRAAPHPKEEKLIEIQMMFDYFANLKEYNNFVFNNAKEAIENAVLPGKDLVITGAWTVDELDAKVVVPDEDLVKKIESNMNATKRADNVSSDDIIPMVTKMVHELIAIESTVDKAVPQQESRESSNNVPEQIPRLQLDKVRARDIYCETINGIPREDIVWRFEDVLKMEGTLEVQSMAILSSFEGRVNGINLTKDLVHSGSNVIHGKASFVQLDVDTLSSTHDINGGILDSISRNGNHLAKITAEDLFVEDYFLVDYINGIEWLSASQEMIRRDLSPRNATLIVEGNLIVQSDAYIDLVDGEPFVDNYIWDADDEFVTVSGHKEFKAPVVVFEIDLDDGKIDGVSPNRLISLAGGAYLPDETTFADNLELIHGLIVTNSSNIEGPYMDKFLSNPTLMQEHLVQAACAFRNLRVEGKVIIKGLLNELNLTSELNKYIYQTENPIQVYGFKEFRVAQVDDLHTELVNGRDLNTFVTLNTEQTLTLSELMGNKFRFDSMQLNGLFDFINLTELNDKSIRTFGDQVTEAHIILSRLEEENPFKPEVELTAKNIIIRDTLNTFPAEVYLDSTNIFAYQGTLEGAEVTIGRLYLNGALYGNPVINGQHLEAFNELRWSKSKVQTITSPVTIHNLINSDFHLTRINSMGHRELAAALSLMNDFKDQFHKHHIHELHITKGANFEFINEEDMHHLLSNVVWLNQSNVVLHDITFLENVRTEDAVVLKGRLNGKFNFLQEVVWKDRGQGMRLKGRVEFRKGIVVEGQMNATLVNEVPVGNLLTKKDPTIHADLVLNRSLKVHSKLTAPYWIMFDNFQAKELNDIYAYDAEKDMHIITMDRVHFDAAPVIPHLFVAGDLNDIPNIVDFLNNIQLVDDPRIVLTMSKSVLSKFWFENVQVEFINGVNLEEFMKHAVVRTNGSTTKEIAVKVQFSNIVESSTVESQDIIVDRINGRDTDEWFQDAVQLSQRLVWEKPVSLSAKDFKFHSFAVQEFNGVPFEKLDFTNRDHHLSGDAVVGTMVLNSFVGVTGLVNGLKLGPEEANSLLVFSPLQTISTKSTFHHVRVMNKLTIEGFVNNKNIQLMIPINGQDIHIESPMSFAHLQTHHLSTNQWINGMDFNSWYKDSVKYNDTDVQNIQGYWKVHNMTVKESILGEDYINSGKLKDLLEAYESNRPHLQRYESELQFAYWKMCSQVKDYFASPLRVGCSFKHLDNPIEMAFPSLSSILVFRHLDQYYLIFSSGCSSRLMLWNTTVFQEVDSISSGHIIKWTYVPSNSEKMHLIAQTGGYCPNVYSNGIWVWNRHNKLALAKQLTPDGISDVYTSPLKRNFFYVIIGGKVQEINVPQLEVTNEWTVQSGRPMGLRFIPAAHDALEVLVTNGIDIHTITIKSSNRFKRHWLTFGARSKRLEEKYKFINEMVFMNKSSFMKLAKEAIINKKFKFFSKLIKSEEPAFDNEMRLVEPKTTSKPTSTDSLSNVSDPNVGGAIFDDLFDTIKSGVGIFTDTSANALSYLDTKYDVEGILDALEDGLLTSTAQPAPVEKEIVGGPLFDSLSDTIRDGTEMFVDVSADVLEGLDKLIDMEEVFERLGEGRSNEEVPLKDTDNGNQSSHYRFSSGLDSTVNTYSPNIMSHDGETIALNVGAGRQIRTLFGVYNTQRSADGKDRILIYENLFIDRPFQTIPCYKPSSLTAWHMDQETLLIFLEDRIMVQIYVFRGMEGFKHYLHVMLPKPVDYLRTALLPWHKCGCLSQFLMAVSRTEVLFLKAETVGNCINEVIECNEY